jgi:hypothetical protein
MKNLIKLEELALFAGLSFCCINFICILLVAVYDLVL